MHKKTLVLFALALLVALSAQATVTRTDNAATAVAPDNGCLDDTATGTGLGGITRTIAFTETGTISDTNVNVNFTHTWRGDLQMVLSYTGGGGTVRLANAHGNNANSDNYHATFDSQAALPCSDTTMCSTNVAGGGPCQTAPGPTCRPDATLDAFNSLASPGTWTLAVCDRAGQDTGTLDDWSVTLDGTGQLPVELMGFSVE